MRTAQFRCEDGAVELREVDPQDPNAFIPAGTWITCPAGHQIMKMLESIHKLQLVEAAQFGPAQAFQSQPQPYKQIGLCFCGRWYAWGSALHTEHGWRGQGYQERPGS